MKLKTAGILFALVAFWSRSVCAETATKTDAQNAAQAWLTANAKFGALGTVRSVSPHVENGVTLWYVVKTETGAVVVSPDTEVEPVIAVIPGSDGEIPAGSPLYTMLQRDLTQRLDAVRVPATTAVSARRRQAATAKWSKFKKVQRSGVRPLSLNPDGNPATIVRWLDGWNSPKTETRADGTSVQRVQTLRFWNQDVATNYFSNVDAEGNPSPIFNLHTPSNYVCGCVATAGSSVMHYFRVPYGRPLYSNKEECRVDGLPTTLATIGGAYDWKLIDDVDLEMGNPQELSAEAIDLLGRVAYDCGVGCSMSYTAGASGSNSRSLMNSFRMVFGLPNAQLVTVDGSPYGMGEKADIGTNNYAKIIYNQIRAGAPVVLGIDGHEVVACGYGYDEDKTDYTYVFLGWAGINDAWYALPEIDTKATVDGGWYLSTFVDELVTEISTDEKYVPVVGRVVGTDGLPLANFEGLTLDDGTAVAVDANGYWGVRVAPGTTREIVDARGEGHAYRIGPQAETTTGSAMAAPVLAQALPDEMTITVDPSATDHLRLYKDLAGARRAAWAKGKLLYLFGGTDADAVASLKADLFATNETFKSEFVFCELSAETYANLVTDALQVGAFDPRVFDLAGDWSAENGLWTPPESWAEENRAPTELKIVGPTLVSSVVAYNYYTNTVIITFGDGLSCELTPEFLAWAFEGTAATFADGVLHPLRGKNGVVTLTATCAPFAGTSVSVAKDIKVMASAVRMPLPTEANGLAIATSSAVEAKANAYQLALNGLVMPSVTVPLSGAPGATVTAQVKELATIKDYVFRCTGYELYKDGDLRETGTFDANSPNLAKRGAPREVGFKILLDTEDVEVKWVWAVEKVRFQTDAFNCSIDKGPQFYPFGESLTITATPPGGQSVTNTLIVWEGARPSEVVNTTQAVVRADAPRTVIANGLSLSSDMTFVTKDPDDFFAAPEGYVVEPLRDEDGEIVTSADGSYVMQVVEAQVEESEATIRVIYEDLALTNQYDRLERAFADVRGDCVVELLADQMEENAIHVFDKVLLRTAADAAAGTCQISRDTGWINVMPGAALTVTNLVVCDNAVEGTSIGVPLLEVAGGTLTLQRDTTVSDQVGDTETAAAIYVHDRGLFTMEPGAVVENCLNDTTAPGEMGMERSVGLAGGLLIDGESLACLKGGRVSNCAAAIGGAVMVRGGSAAEVAGDFAVNGGMGIVEVPFEYLGMIFYFEDETDKNMTVTDDSVLRLAGPLETSGIGRFTADQADTNVVAVVTNWASWNRSVLADSASGFVNDEDGSVRGVVVTNSLTTALVVWESALDPTTGVFETATGEVFGLMLAPVGPTVATPEPIAFMQIEMNADHSEVKLGFTNAVQWCNYAVFGTSSLAAGFGTTPVTNFQWKATEPKVELTLPTNGNLFWKVTAAEGLIP